MFRSTVRMVAAVAALLVTQQAQAYSTCPVTPESPAGSCWLETFSGTSDADLTAAGWTLGSGITGDDYNFQPSGWEGGGAVLAPGIGNVLEIYPGYPTPTTISKLFDLWSEGWIVFRWSVGNTTDPKSAINFETGSVTDELGMTYWYPIGQWWEHMAYTHGGEDYRVGFSVFGRTATSTAPILILDSIRYVPDSGIVPLPSALLLLLSAVAGLGFMRRVRG